LTAKKRKTPQEIRPTLILYDIRKAVSDILDKPFSEKIDHRVFRPDQKVLALWDAECAEHVLACFEEKHPGDDRPQKAIQACRRWVADGVFKMAAIRKASLDAHAAARDAEEEDARAAAHAAGQAVAAAHVPTHALASAVYGIRAAAARAGDADEGLIRERDWQLHRLRCLAGK